MSNLSIAKRIENSIEVLNNFGPDNWWNKINEKELDMLNPSKCIVGQLYSLYSNGIEHLKEASDKNDLEYEGSYKNLTRMWRKAIRNLKQNPQLHSKSELQITVQNHVQGTSLTSILEDIRSKLVTKHKYSYYIDVTKIDSQLKNAISALEFITKHNLLGESA